MAKTLLDAFIHKQPSISQSVGAVKTSQLENIDQLVIFLPSRAPASAWRKLPHGSKLRAQTRRRQSKSVSVATMRLPNKRQTEVRVAEIPADADEFRRLTIARQLIAEGSDDNPRSMGILAAGFDDEASVTMTRAATAAALAAAYPMPTFDRKGPKRILRSIRLLGLANRIDVNRLLAEAEGNNLARCLTAMPANQLDAMEYVRCVRALAKEESWQFRRYGTAELKKMGAGAFLAVAQGNENDSAAIVHLKYRPSGKSATPDLSLVGKGIIFDTGGTNLKPFTSMLDMHTDMGGSAVALAALLTISRLKLPMNVDCWLAITENRTGPEAYKSQDILTAANGMTIQTIHTDAEGRLALADTLYFARLEKPRLVIDYATLTGSCVVGISEKYSGVFSNRSELHPVLKRAGRQSGERVWPFPIGEEFLEGLESDTADIKQCVASGGGDHIFAATFLAEFVGKKTPWVHVDLSACAHKNGLGHVQSEITGFGVRFTTNLLLEQDVLGSL